MKILDKILSSRRPEWHPLAIEISLDHVQVSVFGGKRGFDDPPTAQTRPHDDLEACLLDAIPLLDSTQLLSTHREPYHRRPHHRCVFCVEICEGDRRVELRRRALMRAVPRIGEHVVIGDASARDEFWVTKIVWHLDDDEIRLHGQIQSDSLGLVERYIQHGWAVAREASHRKIDGT